MAFDLNSLRKAGVSRKLAQLLVAGSASSVLATTAYNPAGLVSYTTTSLADVDVDATNLAVTFTAPASGKVLVTVSSVGGCSGVANDFMAWGLREGAVTVAGMANAYAGAAAANDIRTMTFLITGLTPGSSHTYKWAWKTSTGTATARLYAGQGIQALMSVSAA